MSKGTGTALRLAREGKGDFILVHAREQEDRFVMDAYGVNRKDVMYNDFVILGPISDPHGLSGSSDVLSVLTAISEEQVLFISRGDNSGTHIREKSLWKLAGLEPGGDWYIEAGKGMAGALKIASDRQGYIMSDRSTYLHNKEKLQLKIVTQGDRRLFNPYGVIAVNPATVQGVKFAEAMLFIDYITSDEGQEIIGNYGKEKFGTPLFTPMTQ